MEHTIAYCGVDCAACADMREFYAESDSHREAFERMRAISP